MDVDAFMPNEPGLLEALRFLTRPTMGQTVARELPDVIPEVGLGPSAALEALAPPVLFEARDLSAPGFFAHMDPPTPWITWATSMWTASRNQNLLHPDTAPAARELERRVVDWLAPFFGMGGGHLTPGSTIANLTALWAARQAGATEIVASTSAHVSVRKAAHLLALPFRAIDDWGDPGDLGPAAAVLTAGTTATGEIEPLDAGRGARWRHVDAAWAGPLRLSERFAGLLAGIDAADSVAVSAHKWLFQPKESALVLFADHDRAHASISVDGPYLAAPNVGVLGSHGAVAVPLLATLIAYGRSGIAAMIDRSMRLADELHDLVSSHDDLVARSPPATGVVCWKHRSRDSTEIRAHLRDDVFVSQTTVDAETWLRSVAANPNAEPERIVAAVLAAAASIASDDAR
ncbi:MAG: pyridoxal-dependent decarboxylase [Acidimicrobiia bacterium]|nr:pyridoxal-dependent decarboxylase [Acidimicrobiia bacterium]